ncbi:MAG: hypothetical protein IK990_07520 [Ruminiclostridium sp.]|nr:hypothetical protein [Ruminiclostridium sp.]
MQMNDIIALCAGGAVLVIAAVYLIVNQRTKVKEWLKYAVVEAEKLLGSGTGQLKLRTVYDWFCSKFPTTAALLPFPVFSAWVDVALETMRHWLEVGNPIGDYILHKEGDNGTVH